MLTPTIQLDHRCMSASVDAGIELLHDQCSIFRHSQCLYEPVTYFPFELRQLKAVHVQLILEKLARFEKIDHRNNRCFETSVVPLELCRMILARDDLWTFPQLDVEPVLWAGGLSP